MAENTARQEEKVLKERKARAIVAQEIGRIENRRIDISTNEEMTSVKDRNKKIFV